VEIKTEADSNDINERSQDVKPSTGMFAVSDGITSISTVCSDLNVMRVSCVCT